MPQPVYKDEKAAFVGKFTRSMVVHRRHGGWRQVGRCVYCSCGTRLGTGTVPADMK